MLSGVRGSDAAAALERLGFTNIRVVGDKVGQASAIKMIRSVMVKGIEALTAECVLAAERAGVTAEVLGSLGPDDPNVYQPDSVVGIGSRFSIAEVLWDIHDNDLLQARLSVPDTGGDPVTVYRALRGLQVTGVAYQVTGQGYAGPIKLILAVNPDGGRTRMASTSRPPA